MLVHRPVTEKKRTDGHREVEQSKLTPGKSGDPAHAAVA